MRNPKITARRVLLLGFGVTLLASTSIPPAYSISIGGSKKSSSFDLPLADSIDGDTAGDAAQTQAPAANNPDLAPLSLTDTKTNATNATTGATIPDKDGTLNAAVTQNALAPKGPLEGENKELLAPTSVKGSKLSKLGSGNLSETAKSINVAPLALIESSNEVERKFDETQEAEREQLTALWEATLTRSPDINFVLQKLMPNSDPSKTTTVLMRLLSTAAMGGLGAAGMIMPGSGGYMIQSGGMSVMQQLLNITDSKAAKNAKVTQTEQIQLYNMIRAQADKLSSSYRTYKAQHKSLYRANADLEDLKALAPAALKDGAKEFEIQYTLKKQHRDIEYLGSELNKTRQDLLDLAGNDAVAKLDGSIDDEFRRIHPELAPAVVAGEQEAPAVQPTAEPQSSAPANPQVAAKEGDKESKNHFKLPQM